MGTNVDLAPPAVAFDDNKTAVPIDISEIEARLPFDDATHKAHGDATISFVVGPRQAVRSSISVRPSRVHGSTGVRSAWSRFSRVTWEEEPELNCAYTLARGLVPSADSHACGLAVVLARYDQPPPGAHAGSMATSPRRISRSSR